MGANLDTVPTLVRREIEARVLGPLIQIFMDRFGKTETLRLLRPMIAGQAELSGRDAAARAGGDTLAHYAKVMERMSGGGALEEKRLELTDRVFRWNVTRCSYAEMYRELGLADLGYELCCSRDYARLKGFNPKMILHRTKTIMGGDGICDFKVTLDQGSGKRCVLRGRNDSENCFPDESGKGVKRFRSLAWQSDLGPLTAVSTDRGLAGLLFGSPDLLMEAERLAGHVPWELLKGSAPILEKTRAQVEEFLTGQRKEFDLELDLSGTDFQKKVWRALLEIPYGRVITYGQLARRVGRPKAPRAVGQANGANPIPIIVPCHRVVAMDGLGGYGGGLPIKRLLLGIEGVTAADVRAAGQAD